MKIALTADNAAKIEVLLKGVNHAAVAHTFTTFDQIAREADDAERALLALINKGDAKGAYYTTISGSAVSGSFRSGRPGTKAVIERGSKGWFLIELRVVPLTAAAGPRWLTLTPAHDVLKNGRQQKTD